MKDDVTEKIELKKPEEISIVIGEYLQKIFREWKPAVGESIMKLGELYGFNLFIERTNSQDSDMSMRRYTGIGGSNILFFNRFYSQHPDGGLKYLYNHGVPSRENTKIASRNFLNALDRISTILRQYTEEMTILERDIKAIKSIESRPFGREEEIRNLQEDSKRLQREIQIKIQTGYLSVPEKVGSVEEVKIEEVEDEEGEYETPVSTRIHPKPYRNGR